jgi:predicted transcriptional regulator
MMADNLLKNKRHNLLKVLARGLLLYENSEIEEAIISISKRIKISEDKIREFITFLYRHGLLIKYERGQKYSLTLSGVAFLLNLAENCYFDNNLEGEEHEHGRA